MVARLLLHRGDEIDHGAHVVRVAQRAALERHVDQLRRNAGLVEMRFRLVEILLVEDVHADRLAARLARGLLQREAVVLALLDAAQPERIRVLVADEQSDHLGVEGLAGREILRGQHEMAGARDVERRLEVGLWDRHRNTLSVEARRMCGLQGF